MAGRDTMLLLVNKYDNNVVHKGKIPGIPVCMEHTTMMWEYIQRAMDEKSEILVVWLDLANVLYVVPHQLL